MDSIFSGVLNPDAKSVGVIMAGGQGTRFWPLSRRALPKQFLVLSGNESLIQSTDSRLDDVIDKGARLVVTAADQVELVQSHLPNIAILAEPCARNTAPCIGFAAACVLEFVGDVPMLCMPADHLIPNEYAIKNAYMTALEVARAEDVLVSIGVVPTAPETGFGYVRRGSKRSYGMQCMSRVYDVEEFVEKPDFQTAQQYLKSGEYFWNSGTFAWRPSVLLNAIELFLPDLGEKLREIKSLFRKPDSYDEVSRLYESLSKVSIDYGVMEHAKNTVIVEGQGFDWDDVGSWSAWVECNSGKDAHEIVVQGATEVVAVDSKNCGVYGGKRCVALVGVEDIIVVDTPDALLICHKDKAQDVKTVVDELQSRDRNDLL